jgi:NAD(P)H dehydrogenase (quinone)
MTDGLIAISGATGGVGRRVAQRLAHRGLHQRLIARDPARLEVPAAAEVRVIPGYHARTEVRRALDGVSTFFLIPATESPGRTSDHQATVEAAAEAGVRHIVYLSFLGASPESTFTFARDHWATEQDVRRTAPAFTFLRMNTYLDFVPKLAGPDGLISGPAGDGRVAAVLRDDLADVAAAVLASADEHVGKTYDVTGGEAFTLAEAAAEMSRVSGRRIVFRNQTLHEAYQARSGHGAAGWEVEGWISSYTAIAAGELAAVSDVVQRLAGHPPVTLAGYITANPESLAHVRG